MSLAAAASPGTFIPWGVANRRLLGYSQLQLTEKFLFQAQNNLFTYVKRHQEIIFGVKSLGRHNIKQKGLDKFRIFLKEIELGCDLNQ